MTTPQHKDWHFEALTDIWTGDAHGKPGCLIHTGLLGSIRWWYEVLVRGLGGYACDPTKTQCDGKTHCVVCRLFGCTGWARKFRFQVLDAESGSPRQNHIEKNDEFILRFVPLRAISNEEWTLLHMTLRLIADYGAIGGKTTWKPSDEPALSNCDLGQFDSSRTLTKTSRQSDLNKNDQIVKVSGQPVSCIEDLKRSLEQTNSGDHLEIMIRRDGKDIAIETFSGKQHHVDYGIISLKKIPDDFTSVSQDQVVQHLKQFNGPRNSKQSTFAWASLANFWCVKDRYLTREDQNQSSFNQILGRKRDKRKKPRNQRKNPRHPERWSDDLQNETDKQAHFLAGKGGSKPVSKKVFSFRKPARTFGFLNPSPGSGQITSEDMKDRLKSVWPDLEDSDFSGNEIILKTLRQSQQ